MGRRGPKPPSGSADTMALLGALALAACAESGGDAPSTGGGSTWTTTGSGGIAGHGGSAGAGASGGQGGDLGWPFDDSVPEPCEPNPPDLGGTAWTGWANFQHPAETTVSTGQASEPLYGRVYCEGETPGVGQAAGWEAELAVGPYGTLPTGEGRCWSYRPATFNVDVGNDDEYVATETPGSAGLFGLFFRYRPPGGAWRYGDLDGSDDGLAAAQAALLTATEATPSPAPLVVVTLNLRCRLDDWAARRNLVVRALSRLDPDLVAVQEDCIHQSGPTQVEEIRERLAPYTRRGYELRRVSTHTADAGGQSYDEGIAVLSAHRIEQSHALDLPHVHFPRKALAVDVTVRGQALRLYSTHFDYGTESADARTQSAEAILADLPAGRPAIVAGDLNANPQSAAVATLSSTLVDLFPRANPSQPGLTFPASDPDTRIDYLFAPDAVAQALLGARLLDETEGTVLLSDHLGVAVAVTFP